MKCLRKGSLKKSIISCFSVNAVDYDDFNPNDKDAFLNDFDLSNEEIAEMVRTFGIDPSTKSTKYKLEIGIREDEITGYYKNVSNEDEEWERNCEFAARFGLSHPGYMFRFIEDTHCYQTNDGVRYHLYNVKPEMCRLFGAEFVEFAAKLFCAAGYDPKYAAYEQELICIEENVLYESNYFEEKFP